jgi:hypothetical protein
VEFGGESNSICLIFFIEINFCSWQDFDLSGKGHKINMVLIFSVDFPKRMMIIDIQQIETQIRRIAKTGSRGVALSRHCREESMHDHNVDFQDILNVLNWGQVVHDPDENCDMKFKVNGSDLEGEPLTVIVDLFDNTSLLVITVW